MTIFPSGVDVPIFRWDLFGPVRTEWEPGDTVERSGTYTVRHGGDHTFSSGRWPVEHQVICLKGDMFPPCKRCGTLPRFKIMAHGEPIEQNEHFK